MQVKKDTEASEVRINYLRLSRLVHPDKCNDARAPEAAAVINQVCGIAWEALPHACILHASHLLQATQCKQDTLPS